jgi:phosphate transport system permease protein
VFRHTYKVSYPEGKKTISPAVDYPYGEAPIVLNEAGVRWSTSASTPTIRP